MEEYDLGSGGFQITQSQNSFWKGMILTFIQVNDIDKKIEIECYHVTMISEFNSSQLSNS